MAIIETPDNVILAAPAPNPAKSCGTQTVGRPGIRTYYYWVVANYPIGSSVSAPFPIRTAPDLLTATNHVAISWTPVPNVIHYDLLRTEVSGFPEEAGNYAVATAITATFWRDQGAALAHYDPSGLKYGAPVRCRISLNNRDYLRPTLEMPCQLSVTTLIFSDGSTQSTAGGGGGGGGPAGSTGQIQWNDGGNFGASPGLTWDETNENLSVGSNVTSGSSSIRVGNPSQAGSLYLLATTGGGRGLVDLVSNATWTGSLWAQTDPVVSSWAIGLRNSPAADATFPSEFSIRYMNPGDTPGLFPITRFAISENGSVGIGTDSPAYKLDVVGAVNAAGCYLINGDPFACPDGAGGINLTHITTINGSPPGGAGGSQWTDIVGGGIFYSGGNVGIKTNNPQYSLDINGSVNVTGGFFINGVLFAGTGVPLMAGAGGGAKAFIGRTAPDTPEDGEFWFNSNTSELFIRFQGNWLGIQMVR